MLPNLIVEHARKLWMSPRLLQFQLQTLIQEYKQRYGTGLAFIGSNAHTQPPAYISLPASIKDHARTKARASTLAPASIQFRVNTHLSLRSDHALSTRLTSFILTTKHTCPISHTLLINFMNLTLFTRRATRPMSLILSTLKEI